MEFQNSVGSRDLWNSRNTELFLYRCRFMEFHLYSILIQFSNFVNSKNRHYFQNFRFVYFQEYFLFLKWTDFWNSNSRDYLVNNPIFGIPFIWKFPTPIFSIPYPKVSLPKSNEQSNILPTMQGIGRVPSLFSRYLWKTLEVRDPLIV